MAHKTDRLEKVYGVEMPVWEYQIEYSCGCKVQTACGSNVPIKDVVCLWQCPKCYNGPYYNVWD